MAQSVGLPVAIGDYRPTIKDFSTCLDFRAGGIVKIGTTNPFSGNFYFTARVKWYGNNAAYQHIFAKRDSYGASTMMFDLYIDPIDDSLKLDNNVAQKNFAYILPKFKWVTLTWVHNTTDSLDQLFINGVRVFNAASGSLGTGTTALVSVGAVEAGATEPFNGKIDEVVIGNPTTAPTWPDVVAMHAKYVYPTQWAYLKLDEGSGSSATDSSGNSNTGTITTATYSTDRVMGASRTAATNRFMIRDYGTCLKFLGIDGSVAHYVSINSAKAYSPTGYSVELRFKVGNIRKNVNDNALYTEWSSLGGNPLFRINITGAEERINIVVRTDANNIVLNSLSNIRIQDDDWHHLVWTDLNGVANLYIDGVKDTLNWNYTPAATTLNRASLGTQNASTQRAFNGLMDEFVIYDTILSQAQVTSRCYVGKNESNRVVDWKFDEGSGSVATDSSGNSNNGSITGATYSNSVFMKPRTLV